MPRNLSEWNWGQWLHVYQFLSILGAAMSPWGSLFIIELLLQMNTHSWQQMKTHLDTHTHFHEHTVLYVLSCSSLMRRCSRKLLHCRADPSGLTTKPTRNSAILTLPYAIFHTSGLKEIWHTVAPHPLSRSNKPLRISCSSDDESIGVNEKERLIIRTLMAGLRRLSLHLVWISRRIKARRETWFLMYLTTSSLDFTCYISVPSNRLFFKKNSTTFMQYISEQADFSVWNGFLMQKRALITMLDNYCGKKPFVKITVADIAHSCRNLASLIESHILPSSTQHHATCFIYCMYIYTHGNG